MIAAEPRTGNESADDDRIPPVGRIAVSAADAAELLSIGRTRMWELTVPRGPIPSFRIGRSVRYRVDDLRAYAAGGGEANEKRGEGHG